MNLRLLTTALILSTSTLVNLVHAQDAQPFDGDKRLACEAILCLAASQRPHECTPSLRRYYSISFRKFWKTLQARRDFLDLCPSSNDPSMRAAKDALVNGAGRCDAPTINQAAYVSQGDSDGYVNNVMPSYCESYFSNPMVQSPQPRYVGDPEHGGHWVEAADYEAELHQYNERRAAEIQAQKEAAQWN